MREATFSSPRPDARRNTLTRAFMNRSYQRIFVTGADGFIGSHLTETLIRRGYNVRAFVYYNSFNSWGWLDDSPQEIKDSLEVVAGDIRDFHGVREAMRGCDAVLHLAALIAIPYSYRSPETYIDTNVKGTLNVVQAAHELDVKRIIHTSTSEVYGTARFVPITEAHPLSPQSPYSASKISADQIALSFWHSFSTPVLVLRPFNTYGPRQSARAVIPSAIVQVAAGQRVLRLGAMEPTRDFSFVQDTVDGFVVAMEADTGLGQTVNLGTGYEVSIGDTIKTIVDLMGANVTIEEDTRRLRPQGSEVFRLVSDNSLARRLFGWTPRYGGPEGFRSGLSQTIEWFQNPINLSEYKADVYNI